MLDDPNDWIEFYEHDRHPALRVLPPYAWKKTDDDRALPPEDDRPSLCCLVGEELGGAGEHIFS